jgi:hypothetical protein
MGFVGRGATAGLVLTGFLIGWAASSGAGFVFWTRYAAKNVQRLLHGLAKFARCRLQRDHDIASGASHS